MSTTTRVFLGCLGLVGLVVVAVGTLAVLNWDAVSKNVAEALDAQSERTRATLFRLGELMSLSAELEAEYGAKPDTSYDTGTGSRVLSIAFSKYQLPRGVAAQDHAREIAAFAIGKTPRFDQIDVVEVLFQTSANSNSGSYGFARDELMLARPRAEPAEPNDSARE